MNRMMQSRSSYLAHYGVKGMKWGVRKDRGSSGYILKKGSTIRRLTSKEEAKRGTDLSKRFYASSNQHDFDLYRQQIDTLPGTSQTKKSVLDKFRRYRDAKLVSKIGLVTLSAKDDVYVAKGEQVFNSALSKYGDTKLKDIYDEGGRASDRERMHLDAEATVRDTFNSTAINSKYAKQVGRDFIADVMSATEPNSIRYYRVGGKYKKFEAPGQKLHDEFKRKGYDAVEDVEDQLSGNPNFQPKSPLIVLNGDKFNIDSSKVVRRTKIGLKQNSKKK